jgi:hypothetical protein
LEKHAAKECLLSHLAQHHISSEVATGRLAWSKTLSQERWDIFGEDYVCPNAMQYGLALVQKGFVTIITDGFPHWLSAINPQDWIIT